MSEEPAGVAIYGTRVPGRVTYYGRAQGEFPMTDEERAGKIRALLEERAGYVQRGQSERAAQVDAELARIGHQAAKPVERAEKRPAARPAASRSASGEAE